MATRIRRCAGFKTAVESASNGDVITLDAGLTCNDTYVLPGNRPAPFGFTIQGGGGGATLDGSGNPYMQARPATAPKDMLDDINANGATTYELRSPTLVINRGFNDHFSVIDKN